MDFLGGFNLVFSICLFLFIYSMVVVVVLIVVVSILKIYIAVLYSQSGLCYISF